MKIEDLEIRNVIDNKGKKYEVIFDKARCLVYSGDVTLEFLKARGYRLEEKHEPIISKAHGESQAREYL